MHAREVLGAGLADLVRAAGFVDVAHEAARSAAPMQIVAARIGE